MPQSPDAARPLPTRTTTVVPNRWRRYGHDRVYVRVDDSDVGYRDLRSGALFCSDPEYADLVARETERFVLAPEPHRPQISPRPRSASSRLRPDRDLAANQPGAAARAQAQGLKDAAPIYSLVAGMLGIKTDERNWRVGADGEAEVARRLSRLGAEWRIVHAVPIGDHGSDIDHVVIGPAGVFTINTKHHPDAHVWVRNDTVKVNNQNQPYVRNSRYEANRAARLLAGQGLPELDVHGIVAVVGARGVTVKAQPADGRVTVLARKQLVGYLAALPVQLDAPSVDRIHSVARHLATWQPATVRWDDF